MAEESLNDLLRSLQAAVEEAGRHVQAAAAFRRGAPEQRMTFWLPSLESPDAFEAVDIPLESLRSRSCLRIAGVSLDCGCELAHAGLFGARRRTVVRIVPGGGTQGRTRRMRIVMECGGSALGEVRIDGLLLQSLPVPQAKTQIGLGPLRAAISWVLELLLPGRPPEGFVLSKEQARLVEHLCT